MRVALQGGAGCRVDFDPGLAMGARGDHGVLFLDLKKQVLLEICWIWWKRFPVMITTLTGRNQITIPASLAARFSLKPGSRIEWLPGEAPDEIRCRIVPDPARLAEELKGAGRKYLEPGKVHPLDQLAVDRVAEEAERAKSL
jgi:bifunctional DNA-binding transcriptional regulator/antitoxin component of YhaV-PrlF toxin-antitoxin module